MINVEDFKQHGYLVVDNIISKDVANALKEEALRIKQRGALCILCHSCYCVSCQLGRL